MRWGILGAGRIASDFTNALRSVPSVRVVAVASTSLDKAQHFAAQHEIPTAYGSYEQLVQDANVDIVYVATIHPQHLSNTLLCLNNGKHVLVEKPMAMNAKQVKSMIDTARGKGLFLMEAMWTRFFPSVKKAREVIASGTLGGVVSVYGDFGFACSPSTVRMFDPRLGGGALLDIGCYPIAAASMVFGGAAPNAVKATGVLSESKVDLAGAVTLQYGTQGTALVHYSVQAQTPEELTVIGTKGYLRLHSPFHCATELSVSLSQGRGRPAVEHFHFPLPALAHTTVPLHFPNSEGLVYQAQAVDSAVEAGLRECVEFPLDESLTIATVLDEVRRQLGVRYPEDD